MWIRLLKFNWITIRDLGIFLDSSKKMDFKGYTTFFIAPLVLAIVVVNSTSRNDVKQWGFEYYINHMHDGVFTRFLKVQSLTKLREKSEKS